MVSQAEANIGSICYRTRELSKKLLGAQFRAEVAAFVAVGEAPFWARGMAERLAIPENKVSAELSRFAAAGLLATLMPADWDRRKLYERRPDATHYWELGLELVRRAAADEALRSGLDSSAAFEMYLTSVHGTNDARNITRAR